MRPLARCQGHLICASRQWEIQLEKPEYMSPVYGKAFRFYSRIVVVMLLAYKIVRTLLLRRNGTSGPVWCA